MQNRRIIFAKDLCRRIIAIEPAIGHVLHNSPKLINVMITEILTQPLSNDYKSLLVKAFSPLCFLRELKSVLLVETDRIWLHISQRFYDFIMNQPKCMIRIVLPLK